MIAKDAGVLVTALGLLSAISLSACDPAAQANATVGNVSEDAFYVQVLDERLYPFYLHAESGFRDKCRIPSGAKSQDVTCYLELNEGDVYDQPIKLQYNVPSKMCDYLVFSNYFYYNFEVGQGPDTILIDRTVDASGNVVSGTCTAEGKPCTDPDAEVSSFDLTSGAVSCVYDRTLEELPNCCFGAYTETIVTHSPTGTSTSKTRGKWGGSIGDCTSGPAATDDDWPKTAHGRPVSLITFVSGKGLNATYEVKPPEEISATFGSFHTADSFTPGNHDHFGIKATTTTSVLPYAMDPIDDRNGTFLGGTEFGDTTQDSFEFRCEDRGFEVLNRIRLYIREWNTIQEFNTFGREEGAQGDPDVAGIEGTNCDYNLPISRCNDLGDWDDIVALFGKYNGATPAATAVNRHFFFPSEPRRR